MSSNLELVAFHLVSFENEVCDFAGTLCPSTKSVRLSTASSILNLACHLSLRAATLFVFAGPLFHRTGRASFAKPSQFAAGWGMLCPTACSMVL